MNFTLLQSTLKKIGLLLFWGGWLASCASFEKNYQDAYCYYDASFRRGMMDAAENRRLDLTVGSQCAEDQRIEVEQGYRAGYAEGRKSEALFTSGFDPESVSQAWSCIDAYGERTCGYHCVDAMGAIHCARKVTHRCVQAFGFMKCGLNCRQVEGRMVCDEH